MINYFKTSIIIIVGLLYGETFSQTHKDRCSQEAEEITAYYLFDMKYHCFKHENFNDFDNECVRDYQSTLFNLSDEIYQVCLVSTND